MHPGRDKLAQKAGVSVAAVKRTLALLRKHKVLIAVAHLNGLHGKATEYVVDVAALFDLCAMKKSDIPVNGGSFCTSVGRVKMTHRSCDVVPFPSHKIKSSGGANA